MQSELQLMPITLQIVLLKHIWGQPMNSESVNINKEGYLEEHFHFFHLRDTAGQERDFHFHEFDKIVILISGKADYAVESRVYELAPWDVLLVRHHAIHKAVIDKSQPYERIIIYLNESHYLKLLPEAGLTDCFAAADRSGRYLLYPDEAQKSEIRDIIGRYEKYAAGGDSRRGAMLDTFIAQLLIVINGISSDAAEKHSSPGNDRIERVLSYINENLSGDLSVETLSEKAFMSRYHFMRSFKEHTGETVHGYVRQRRLMNASRLIREGMPAARAAAESGFEDYSAFYRAFKTSFGVTPGELKSV